MAQVLVDANVLLDIILEDPNWFGWSSNKLIEIAANNSLAINPIIYSEISIRYERIEDLEQTLTDIQIERLQLPWEAAFLAGKCFIRYRKRGGTKRSPLPDFFVGAHALISGMPLMTRDANRYRTYFPKLQLIAPE
jgi:predicted nucleic acid-binding protein